MPTVITKIRAVCLDSHSESLTEKQDKKQECQNFYLKAEISYYLEYQITESSWAVPAHLSILRRARPQSGRVSSWTMYLLSYKTRAKYGPPSVILPLNLKSAKKSQTNLDKSTLPVSVQGDGARSLSDDALLVSSSHSMALESTIHSHNITIAVSLHVNSEIQLIYRSRKT